MPNLEHLTNPKSLFLDSTGPSDLSQLSSCIALSHLGHLSINTTSNLDALPNTLLQLTLHIAEGRVRSLPAAITALCQLQELHLKECIRLSDLPEHSLQQLTSLTSTCLHDCPRIKHLPAGIISSLTNLQHLDISGTCISQLPQGITQLSSSLTSLSLDESDITELPAAMWQLTSLRHRNLARLPLEKLPAEICQLSNLETLDMSFCASLQHLPAQLGALAALTSLSLTACSSLSQVPASVSQLGSLASLCLSGTKATQLPGSISYISQLSALTELDLSNMPLQQLAPSISQLTGLQRLSLAYCRELQHKACAAATLAHLTSLQELDLSFTTVTADGIERYSCHVLQLTSLVLGGCTIDSLPAGISRLTQLRSLGLMGCQSLLSLPDSTSRLTQLTDLRLALCSGLQRLPEGLGQLKHSILCCTCLFVGSCRGCLTASGSSVG
jgi:internalin A